MNRIAIVIAATLAAGVLAQAQTEKDPAVVAAQRRQDMAKTVVIDFKRTDVDAAGSRSGMLPEALKGRAAAGQIPDKETTTESNNRVILDGEKMRYEDKHPDWNLSTGTQVEVAEVTVSDNNIGMHLSPEIYMGKPIIQGSLRGPGDRLGLDGKELIPILLAFRGAEAAICPFSVATMKPTGASLPIDGANCVEYARTRKQWITTAWLDPAKDYVVRRIAEHFGDKLVRQFDMQYRHDEKWGWVPESWVISDFDDNGAFETTTRGETTGLRIGDPQEPSQFQIRFPPGARIFDRRDDKRYVILPDGSMKEVRLDGSGTEGVTVSQPGESFVYRHRWFLASVCATVVALFAYGIMRRTRPRREG